MALTRAQIDEIQQRLDEGMTPEAIADSLGRLADLDELDIVTIRSTAYDLVNGEPVRAPTTSLGDAQGRVVSPAQKGCGERVMRQKPGLIVCASSARSSTNASASGPSTRMVR